jgi:phage repressor protein C with HTH and peptisase S24 domain
MSRFVVQGNELQLSNAAQLALIDALTGRGAACRTTVRGSSMWPFIRDGDVVTVAPCDRWPRVGQVVAAASDEPARLVVHRVVQRRDGRWLTRGDNLSAADGYASREQILGRVVRVEHGGRAIRCGLGPEARVVAALSRSGVLVRLAPLLARARRAVRPRRP